MYRTKSGEEIFVIDGHTHLWDGSPANQKNIHGKQFIECFYAYHSNLSPPSEKWPKDNSRSMTPRPCMTTCSSMDTTTWRSSSRPISRDFYKNGFNTTEQNAAQEEPPRSLHLQWRLRSARRQQGLEALEANGREVPNQGRQALHRRMARRSEGLQAHRRGSLSVRRGGAEIGIKNIHVHKGPTILPLNRDAFDVHESTMPRQLPGPELHRRALGLPRLDDFCWIVTGDRTSTAGWRWRCHSSTRGPRYFASCHGGAALLAGDRQAALRQRLRIWKPKWLIEKFMAFEFPTTSPRRPARP